MKLFMTDKELRRLSRQDLLRMLVEQTKEAARLETELEEKKEEIGGLQESLERLKGKLDEKDVLIEKLKTRLDEKDAMIERLKSRLNHKDDRIQELEEEVKVLQTDKWKELEEDGTAAEVLLRLRALFR